MNTHFQRSILSLAVLCAGLLSQSGARAVTLNTPSGNFANTALPGTTVAARPELAGTVLQDLITPFSFNGVSGTVQNRVVRESTTGTLDFYWKIDVDPSTSGVGISAFRLINFGYDNITDADWRIDGLGDVAPTIGRLFNVSNYPDGAINFVFGTAVQPGQSSNFFFLHTDATAYAKTAFFDLLNAPAQSLSGQVATFAPSAVPEPSSIALTIGGLALVGWTARRRSAR